MHAFANLLFFLVMVILVPLAVVGAVVLFTPAETARQRQARQAREAERRITEIGRRAQAVILGEALRRAQARPEATREAGEPPDNQQPGPPWRG